MDRLRSLGIGIAVLSTAGYVAGIAASYPGRAFSVTGVMVGVTLAATADGLGGDRS